MTPARLSNLKGKIKKLDQKEYHLNDEKIALELTSGTPTFILLFNEDFKIIEEYGNLNKYKATYFQFIEGKEYSREWLDNYGNVIQIELFEYDSYSKLATKFYKRNENGVEEHKYLGIEEVSRNKIIHHNLHFDDVYFDNKLIESNANYSTLKFKFEYFDDFYIKRRYMNETLEGLEKFNKNDFLVENIQYDKNGIVTRKEIRNYDENDNLIEIYSSRSENGFQEPEIFIYNDINLLVEKKRLSKDFEFYTVRQYEYDFQGNLIREKGDWNNAKFQYKYDEFENWIEKLEIKASKIVCRTTREIEYYD